MSKKPHEMAQLTENEYFRAKTLAKELRSELKPLIPEYFRIFTEPRKNGLRSKFWIVSKHVNPIAFGAAVQAFNDKYSNSCAVEFDMHGDAWGFHSISIYLKMK